MNTATGSMTRKYRKNLKRKKIKRNSKTEELNEKIKIGTWVDAI